MNFTAVRGRSGITLIALVITTIVLLMLAGIAISMLIGENGIISKANTSKTKMELATVEENVKLAVMNALVSGSGKIEGEDAFRALNDGLNKAGYTGGEIDKDVMWPVKITINKNNFEIKQDGKINTFLKVKDYIGIKITEDKVALLDEDGKNIIVPKGFKIKEDSTELVKKGIVVVAPDGSEFVWIPVNNPSEMYGTDNEGKILGKLYDWTKLNENGIPSNLNWTEENEKMSVISDTGNREPDIVDNYDSDSSYNIVGLTKDELEEDFSKMIESVNLNKGFYMGRYETSLREKTEDSGNIVKIAQSKKGKTSATGASDGVKSWYGLYKIEKEYSLKNNLENIVGSSMVWGCQYDQMMLWMLGNGIDVNSFNPTNLDGEKTSKNETKETGNKEYDKINNIYDLLGCNYEWTLEALNKENRPWRGGVSDWNARISNRDNNDQITPNSEFSWVSSRITLYIQ